ncbi:MAG: hypothetical protein IH946_04560 [Bacteroidetes bacterium]|nr:hypothetical protein [Bacteroidota bacterium]
MKNIILILLLTFSLTSIADEYHYLILAKSNPSYRLTLRECYTEFHRLLPDNILSIIDSSDGKFAEVKCVTQNGYEWANTSATIKTLDRKTIVEEMKRENWKAKINPVTKETISTQLKYSDEIR